MISRLLFLIVIVTSLLTASVAAAHFLLNLNVRILHIEHVDDGLSVYLRLPMPYLVADKLGPVGTDGDPEPAPYTINAREDGKLVHYLDPEQLRDDPAGLGAIAADGHIINFGGKDLTPNIVTVAAHKRGKEPSFATLEEAKASLAGNGNFPDDPAPYVGDTVIDVHAIYSTDASVNEYTVRSDLDPGLPGQEETANLIIDYGSDEPKIFRSRGLMLEPVPVSASQFSAIRTFIEQGILHILEGTDHVLFVLCLIIGATTLLGLVERVTGFTIGHTVTLIAGFMGYVPSGAWFVPAVELGIAITIVYAAWMAVKPGSGSSADTLQMFLITTAIGLLHGFGFSFVLHEILRVDSPNLWQSLIAFNVGVEIGQLLIILLVWPLFILMRRFNERAWQFAKLGVAAACSVIAAYWIVERTMILIAA